jgi:hypothetical protein
MAQYITGVLADNELTPGLTTARYSGMGGVGVAAADDNGAINFNPANLGALNIASDAAADTEDEDWDWQVGGTIEAAGELDYWAVHLAGNNPSKGRGFGASFHSTDAPASIVADWWLAGIGSRLCDSPWHIGLSVLESDEDLYGDETILNFGLLYKCESDSERPIRAGLTVEDLTEELDSVGPFLNLGVAVPFTCGGGEGLVGVDLLDATDEVESLLNVGVELRTRQSWAFRAGLVDSDRLTVGAGYDGGEWRADVSWAEEDVRGSADNQVLVTVSALLK